MKLIFISVFLCGALTIFSQNFGKICLNLPQQSAERYLDKQIKKGQKKGNIIYSTKRIVEDTLIYFIQHSLECFSMKMTFKNGNQTDTTKRCDYHEILFECPGCAKNHKKEIINNCNFRQKSENSYLSSYYFSTEMTIHYDSLTMNPLRVIYRPVKLARPAYIELYKSLKKKNAT